MLSSDADIIIIDPEREYSQLVNAMGGEVINISATSDNHINAMDMNKDYGDGANPVILKSEFIMSLCEQLIGGTNLGAKQKSIIDRCTASVYRSYQQNDYQGHIPTLQDFRAELLQQDEPEAKELALAIELFTHGSLNTFANSFIVNNINIVQGKEKIFVSMPSYKTKQVDEQGKPIYQDVCYPVTKDFREKLYNEIISEYEKAKDKSNEKARESAEKHHGNPDKEKDKEATPFR